jgi:hypothetical protein
MGALDWLGEGRCAGCGHALDDCACGAVGGVEGTAREHASEERTQDKMGKVVKLKESEEVELVHGIDARKLDKEAIDDAIESLDLKVPKKSSIVERVAALKEAFGLMVADDLSGPCTNCGAVSSLALDACPFCGVGEEDAATKSARVAVTEPAPPPESPPPPPKTGKRAIVREDAPVAVAAEVVDVLPHGELDRLVEEIRALVREGQAGQYEIAERLTQISKSESYKQRKTADGRVAYSKLEDFAKAELGFHRKYVQDLLHVFTRYTRTDVLDVGATKLRLVLQLPEGSQQEMLDKLRSGEAGRRDIEQKLGRRGIHSQTPGKDRKKLGHKPGKAAPTNSITVAQVEGKHTIKMHARPSHRGEELRPARKLADQPFAVWDLANDVRMQFAVIQNAAGELVMKVEVKRIAPGA